MMEDKHLPVSKMDFSDRPAVWERLTADDVTGFKSAIREATRRDRERVERAVRGAIRADYDGVDINRPSPTDGIGIVSIEPWHHPPPDSANGHRTERYSWDWFSDEELATLLTADSPPDELQPTG